MLYNDRGMKKWQGFVLAEHGAALTENKRKNQKIVAERDQQIDEELGKVLEHAFRNNETISIQLNCKKNGLYDENIVGTIQGFEDGFVFISNSIGIEAVDFSMIRNVENIVREKWYQ